jgi:hypothetical protein
VPRVSQGRLIPHEIIACLNMVFISYVKFNWLLGWGTAPCSDSGTQTLSA